MEQYIIVNEWKHHFPLLDSTPLDPDLCHRNYCYNFLQICKKPKNDKTKFSGLTSVTDGGRGKNVDLLCHRMSKNMAGTKNDQL